MSISIDKASFDKEAEGLPFAPVSFDARVLFIELPEKNSDYWTNDYKLRCIVHQKDGTLAVSMWDS